MCCTASLECGNKPSAVYMLLIFEKEILKAFAGLQGHSKV